MISGLFASPDGGRGRAKRRSLGALFGRWGRFSSLRRCICGGMPRQDPELTVHAREMRNDPTEAEAILWRELRGKTLGPRFRRQAPIGPYVADVACYRARLIIEIDGLTHDTPQAEEYYRRRSLVSVRGWEVCRVGDEDVWDNISGVVAEIIMILVRRGVETDMADDLMW